MPTDILRSRSTKAFAASQPVERELTERLLVLKAGGIVLRARLAATASADLIWHALPIFGVAEPWGETIHFEIPIRSGRDRTARLQARVGDICLWCEERRVIVPFGPTPISRPNEIRMPSPVNVIATALDDVEVLRGVRVGEKVTLARGELA
ncbi:MAG TPA: cyclophilin-like family protein [Hyphomicrobiaceae bacterium]|nr:cyclophilin-like family protein [Hyphomicrobiaceae bacterium]